MSSFSAEADRWWSLLQKTWAKKPSVASPPPFISDKETEKRLTDLEIL